MKIFKLITLLLILTFTVSNIGCSSSSVGSRSSKKSAKTVVKTKRIPPGQAKKIRGDKSAKRYAPGQRKK